MIVDTIEEVESGNVWMVLHCAACGFRLGAEGLPHEVDSLLTGIHWTDEAAYQLTRLPPYAEPLVRDEVVAFAKKHGQHVLTSSRMVTAQHKEWVAWNPEAEKRLARVPASVRAMAKIELERAAIDRRMAEVTVPLMEELKARYFGMSSSRT